jgi:hypothetical protein
VILKMKKQTSIIRVDKKFADALAHYAKRIGVSKIVLSENLSNTIRKLEE